LREIRWDAVLRQSWAVLEDTEHPERPLWAELTDAVGPATGSAGVGRPPQVVPVYKPTVTVIHYGDRVRLWRNERNVRIEMSAIADGSGGVGDEVRLRIPGSGVDGDTGWRVSGIVQGPGDVEMEQ
jgi:hypothetical protein